MKLNLPRLLKLRGTVTAWVFIKRKFHSLR